MNQPDGIKQMMNETSTTALLCVENLTMVFSGLIAVNQVSFQAHVNEITALIGPNGAGKTTVFNCLTGFYRPTGGCLRLAGDGNQFYRLEKMQGHQINKVARIARTFQNIRLFAGMSVLENLMVAQHNQLMKNSFYTVSGLLGLPYYQRAEKEALARAVYWLEKTKLLSQANQNAGNLSYGAQRRLEIARAMCTRPLLLCLDEPAAGLNPSESAELSALLLDIRNTEKIGILLIEHDMNVVMGISNRIVVLDYGRKIAEGTPVEVRHNPVVIAAYLGEELVEERGLVSSSGVGVSGVSV